MLYIKNGDFFELDFSDYIILNQEQFVRITNYEYIIVFWWTCFKTVENIKKYTYTCGIWYSIFFLK